MKIVDFNFSFRRKLGYLALFCPAVAAVSYSEIKHVSGHRIEDDYTQPLPIDYLRPVDLPYSFSWGNVSGTSYLTKSLNQHLPQWCGSCFAHGALSSLADRIKIARNAKEDDINLAIQFILNCGGDIAGSCHGGSHTGVYEFIKMTGFVPFDTCMPYLACSSDSTVGFCAHLDTSCSAINICRTCNTFVEQSGFCAEIDVFPNATISEYGTIKMDPEAIMAEIYARGPVAAEVAGEPLHNYTGGIFADEMASRETTHVVSVIGWGNDNGGKHWIVRNSWGEYWGERGYCKIRMGSNVIGIEKVVAWATPGYFTDRNYPCFEDGSNCGPVWLQYKDPSKTRLPYGKLRAISLSKNLL